MQRKKLLLFALLSVFSISFVSIANAATEDNLSDEQIENIEANCASIKRTLKTVQNTDRNTRVSLGRSFQTISEDFITPLNVRLVKNNDFSNNLADIQNEYAEAREEFNRKYIEYSQELESLISTECKDNARGFYAKLESTRNKRTEVLKDAKKLQEIVEKHIQSVGELKNSYKKVEDER
jgi:hypothetical protein